ncbi:MAG: lecithin retinol acyltransferase family protein [Acholeplasmatales bacterium]|nr:lecithin retinol acyltransferase family protein [Acholeplasmatales bacterium]
MWSKRKPEYGDQIRVSRGLYYHHGIYKDDETVIQFASPIGSEVSPETARIIITSLKEFIKDGELEVRSFSKEEKSKKRSPLDIIKFAESKLGDDMGGYDIIRNNCEHFANLCIFGESKSDQIDGLMSIFGGLFR